MTRTIEVPWKSRLQIEKEVQPFLRQSPRGWMGRKKYVPLQGMFQSGEIDELIGNGFIVDMEPDLPRHVKGQTDFESRYLSISESTYVGLMKGHGHDRFTMAHEITHAISHDKHISKVHRELKVPMKVLNRESKTIPYECDAEWQANCGGSAILMPLRDAVYFIKDKKITPTDNLNMHTRRVMWEYGMSYSAAKIRINVVLEMLRDHEEEVMQLIAA